jgi:hypothetical protein
VNVRVCPRCQTPAQAGGKVCERCEQPLDGPAHTLRYNPAGLPTPSPIQGHATVLVGIVTAVALLAFGAWFAFRSVGPFRAEVVSQAVSADGTAVEVRSSEVRLSPTVPGDGSVLFGLRGEGLGDAHDLRSSCA